MATHPDPDQPNRPEDQQAPPPGGPPEAEDAAFAELMDEDALPGGGTPPAPSGSAVNLGQTGPGAHTGEPTPPGESSYPWADLVPDAAGAESGGSPEFDAPSDAEVRRRAEDEDAPVGTGDTADRESSRVNLSEPGPAEDFETSQPSEAYPAPAAPVIESGLYVAEAVPPAGPEGEMSEAAVIEIDSGVDMAAVPPGQEASAVDLGAVARPPTVEDSSAIDLGGSAVAGAVLVDSSSGLDLEGAVVIEGEGEGGDAASAVDLGSAEVISLEGSSVLPLSGAEGLPAADSRSDVFVGADAAPAGEAPSGLDGSGIDLAEPVDAPAPKPASSSGLSLSSANLSDDDVGTSLLEPGETGSSVNLGAPEAGEGDRIRDEIESGVDLARAASESPESGSYAEVVITEGDATPEAASLDLEFTGAPPASGAADEEHEPTREWRPGDEMAAAGGRRAGRATLPDEEGSGHVELGGPPPGGDSDEGTLEDKDAGDEDEEVRTQTLDTVGAFEEADEEAAASVAGPAAVEDDDRPKRKQKVKGGNTWGGAAAGAGVAAAACLALWTFGIEPPKGLRMVDSQPEEKKLGPQGSGGGGGPGTRPPAPPVTVADLLQRADFTQDPPDPNPGDANDQAKHGEFVWLRYLSQSDPQKLSANDEGVKKALASLKAAADAGNADALYWQGHVHEALKNPQEARKTYQAGAEKFKGDPAQKARFEGALDRLDVRFPAPAAPAPGARLPARPDAAVLAILALLQPPAGQPTVQPPMAVQPPGPMPAGAQPPAVPEAGFAFWKAVKAAQSQNYADAGKALADARKYHEARRLGRIRKAQNPDSDPDEVIFLKVCDELAAYWQLQEKLKSGRYLDLAQRRDPVKALDGVFAELKTTKEAGEKLQKDLDTVKDDKKKVDEKVLTLEGGLDKSKKETVAALAQVKDREEKITKLGEDLRAETSKLAKAAERGDRLDAEKKDLQTTVDEVAKALKLKDVDLKKAREELVAKAGQAVELANAKDPKGELAARLDEVRRLTGTLKERWTPETMLGYWVPLLSDRGQKSLAAPAVKDAERVLADAKASAAAKAQAGAVAGLALRNRGEFDKARKALEEATGADAAGPWKDVARQALKDLTDPSAYYLPRAEALLDESRHAEALKVLDESLAVFPDNGRLLALRSVARLEEAAAKARGRLTEDAAGVKEAQADAAAAVKAGSQGAGHFAAGHIAEALGQREAAAASYRKAVLEAPAGAPESARYRLALARVLVQKADGRGARLGRPRVVPVALSPVEALVMAVIGLQPPSAEAAQEEAVRLADEILARKDIDQQPLLKAEALAVKGLWTQALNTYTEGLRPHLSREQAAGLKYIVDNHPAQKRPDRMRIAQPFQAERHYAAGLSRYFERNYAAAEQEFLRAVENYDQDARYHYFLGLARLLQNKRGAAEDLDQAARLEAEGRPTSEAVDGALERVQGSLRRRLNEVRERPR